MDSWQAHAIIAQHIAGLMMEWDDEPKVKAPRRRIRLLPRIDIRGWVARMNAAATQDRDALAVAPLQDVECA